MIWDTIGFVNSGRGIQIPRLQPLDHGLILDVSVRLLGRKNGIFRGNVKIIIQTLLYGPIKFPSYAKRLYEVSDELKTLCVLTKTCDRGSCVGRPNVIHLILSTIWMSSLS